jgi:hypothetical protein
VSDIVQRLRGWCPHIDGYPRFLIDEAADDITSLRADLAAAIKQRDEARRLYRALLDGIKDAASPREKEGGGA